MSTIQLVGGFLEDVLYAVSPPIIFILEIIGIIIIVFGAINALKRFFTVGFSLADPTTKIILGESFAMALEFKLGAEIIKTVIVHDFNELLILGFVVVLRIILTFVIHWEVEQAGGAHVIERKKEGYEIDPQRQDEINECLVQEEQENLLKK